MSADNTQARLDGVLRANKSLAEEVERLRAENRHLRSGGIMSLRDPGEAHQYAMRVVRGLYIAAAAAQRNGHNGLAAMLSEQAGALKRNADTNPLLSMPDVDPTFDRYSPALANVAAQQHLLLALA